MNYLKWLKIRFGLNFLKIFIDLRVSINPTEFTEF